MFFYLTSLVFPLLFNGPYLVFPFFLLASLFSFSSNHFSFYSAFLGTFADSVSLFTVFILFCVMYFSFLWFVNFSGLTFLLFLFFFLNTVCYFVFSSSNLLVLYASYETSLIPIILIIILWGSYPERSLSSLMLLVYTSIFTIPFMGVLFYLYSLSCTFSFIFLSSSLPGILSFITFFVFAVNLPIYGLHFWLPMAHVEAPTFGSMVLAGILLKLGGVGLIRSFNIISWGSISSSLSSYFVVFLLYSTLLCCFQSDFNRLIAYSSVSHMMVVPILMLVFSVSGLKVVLLVLLFHGFSSPALFAMVGHLYSVFNSRQLFFMRGLLLITPIMSLLLILGFMFSLCVPPFPSYVSEIMFFTTGLVIWPQIIVVLVVFSLLSLVYNLNWLSFLLFNSPTQPVLSNSSLSYINFFSIFILLFLGALFIFLFSFV